MVQFVLLPLYGSWFNEDFAAIQPTHQHLFLDGIKPNHHAPGSRLSADPHKPLTDEAEGVVNLPDQTIGGMGLIFILFLCAAAVTLPDGKNGLQTIFTLSYIRLTGIFPPPLVRPPRI
jgi:hypothetical protein